MFSNVILKWNHCGLYGGFSEFFNRRGRMTICQSSSGTISQSLTIVNMKPVMNDDCKLYIYHAGESIGLNVHLFGVKKRI